MTELLDQAIALARRLPADDDIARAISQRSAAGCRVRMASSLAEIVHATC